MHALPLAKFEFGELLGFAFYLLVFVLPAAKAIIAKRKKEAEGKSPLDEKFEPEEPEIDPWEELMRGMTPERVSTPPVAAVEPTPEPVVVRAPAVVRSELLREDAFESMESVDSTTLSAASAHSEHHEAVTHFKGASRADEKIAHFASKDFQSLDDRSTASEGTIVKRRRNRRARSIDWRRAVIEREILGAPVTLRGEASELPGLR